MTFVVFIVANVFFMVLDLTGKPAALMKYKIQADKGVPVCWSGFVYIHGMSIIHFT